MSSGPGADHPVCLWIYWLSTIGTADVRKPMDPFYFVILEIVSFCHLFALLIHSKDLKSTNVCLLFGRLSASIPYHQVDSKLTIESGTC